MSQQTATASGAATSQGAPMAGAASSIREFLAFKLGREEYGIDILRGVIEENACVPALSSAVSSDHLMGIGSVGDRRLILLDSEKLMTSNEMGLLDQTLH